MPLRIEQKKAVVEELNSMASSSVSAAIAEYKGLNVAEITELRTKARESGVYLKVVKNSLSKQALTGTDFECLTQALQGPIMIALSADDLASPARLFKDFGKDYEHLKTVGLAIDGDAYPSSDLDRIARLPTRDEAYSIIAGLMKAPIEKALRTLNEVPIKLARLILAIKENQEEVS
ncbi:MAG TPA: 50S ribosomal protein L10 [Gammaproteobacteria bacterium]|jgi:large subunit ribosomal protein L10|nr:50S ribosomal protein L10 [Gammaproteobacteria bacterium]HJP41963.1 50S ribosomal protein L10 [Gammaproteobacteria bacterium]